MLFEHMEDDLRKEAESKLPLRAIMAASLEYDRRFASFATSEDRLDYIKPEVMEMCQRIASEFNTDTERVAKGLFERISAPMTEVESTDPKSVDIDSPIGGEDQTKKYKNWDVQQKSNELGLESQDFPYGGAVEEPFKPGSMTGTITDGPEYDVNNQGGADLAPYAENTTERPSIGTQVDMPIADGVTTLSFVRKGNDFEQQLLNNPAIVALVRDSSGQVVDGTYNWETAQTMANEGYRIQVLKGDGHLSKEEFQKMVDYEYEIALDAFGPEHSKGPELEGPSEADQAYMDDYTERELRIKDQEKRDRMDGYPMISEGSTKESDVNDYDTDDDLYDSFAAEGSNDDGPHDPSYDALPDENAKIEQVARRFNIDPSVLADEMQMYPGVSVEEIAAEIAHETHGRGNDVDLMYPEHDDLYNGWGVN